MKNRYFIELSFKGTNFHGWQIQENAVSVQGELNKALSILFKENIETTGCGRTDTGVHAMQFFAHFDGDLGLVKDARKTGEHNENSKLESLTYHLNRIVSNDISIKHVFAVAPDAHARFDASSRTYEYIICLEKDPFLQEFAHFIHDTPDTNKMNEAAALLSNFTDFSCFSKSNTQVFTNNCVVTQANWRITGNKIIFTITANRFLRNMVRAIVGTLLEIGRNKMSPSDIAKIIEGKKRSDAGMSVPAQGLYLIKVDYPYMIKSLF